MRTFTRLHHKRQARVDAVGGLLGLLGWGHRCVFKIDVLVLNVELLYAPALSMIWSRKV